VSIYGRYHHAHPLIIIFPYDDGLPLEWVAVNERPKKPAKKKQKVFNNDLAGDLLFALLQPMLQLAAVDLKGVTSAIVRDYASLPGETPLVDIYKKFYDRAKACGRAHGLPATKCSPLQTGMRSAAR